MSAIHSQSMRANHPRVPGHEVRLEPVVGRRIDLGRLFGVPVMVLVLIGNIIPLLHLSEEGSGKSLSTVADIVGRCLTIAFYSLFVAVYLRRSPARATTPSRTAAVVAVVTTFLPFSIGFLNHGTSALPLLIVANVLLIAGLSFSLWSLRSLDRSFSIIAQARTVIRKGPYSLVRHPLYTGELAALLGIVLLNPHWSTFALWLAMCGLQAYRAHHEEAILLATLPDYAEYQRETPQLLPISVSRLLPR